MKRTFLKNWMVAALLAGACCGMAACDDDDDKGGTTPPPTDPDITAVCGEYAGTMTVVEVAPAGDGGAEEPAGTSVDATVTSQAIEFADFPVRDLIVKILGTEEGIDGILAAIGTVSYEVPYMAQMNGEETVVEMTLTPEPLKLTLSDDAEEPTETEIEVTIEATAGSYTLETGKLGFGLSVAQIKVGGTDLDGFESFSLDFDLAKK